MRATSAGMEGMEPIDYVDRMRARAAPETLCAYRVSGLCLEPDICPGDTVVVDTALSPANGDLVVVLVEGRAALKRYKEAIVVFTNLIKNYSKDENLKESLFNIGLAYKLQGNKDKAVLFFNKVLKMLPEGPVDRKAKKELSSLKS